MYALLVLFMVLGLSVVADSAELEQFFAKHESPFCGVRTVIDHMVSVCALDASKRPSNKCEESVPIHKVATFNSCAHVAHGPIPPSQEQSVKIEGEENLRRASFALKDIAWPKIDWLVECMKSEPCKEIGKKIGPIINNIRPVRDFLQVDAEMPGWRQCMTTMAENFQSTFQALPDVMKINRLNSHFASSDISKPEARALLDAFVLAMEEEPDLPVPWDKAMHLLGLEEHN